MSVAVMVTVPADDERYKGQPFVGTTFRGTLLYYIEEAEAWVIQCYNDPTIMDIFPRCFFGTRQREDPPTTSLTYRGIQKHKHKWTTYTIRRGVIDWQENHIGGMQTPGYVASGQIIVALGKLQWEVLVEWVCY